MITVVEPHFYWPQTTIDMFPLMLKHIERSGRICYKSEDKITNDSAQRFVEKICKSKHESVLEHFSTTAIIVCSRACSHQIVRHRIGSYSQESMRFVNYGKCDSLKVICPQSIGLLPGDYSTDIFGNIFKAEKPCSINTKQERWSMQIDAAYREYKYELARGVHPEDARYVLPNATRTELAVTYNVRSWNHFFKMRCSPKAQWEIKNIATAIRTDLNNRFPGVF